MNEWDMRWKETRISVFWNQIMNQSASGCLICCGAANEYHFLLQHHSISNILYCIFPKLSLRPTTLKVCFLLVHLQLIITVIHALPSMYDSESTWLLVLLIWVMYALTWHEYRKGITFHNKIKKEKVIWEYLTRSKCEFSRRSGEVVNINRKVSVASIVCSKKSLPRCGTLWISWTHTNWTWGNCRLSHTPTTNDDHFRATHAQTATIQSAQFISERSSKSWYQKKLLWNPYLWWTWNKFRKCIYLFDITEYNIGLIVELRN
jgi:hypothetical protein